jgi:hypothetical protein
MQYCKKNGGNLMYRNFMSVFFIFVLILCLAAPTLASSRGGYGGGNDATDVGFNDSTMHNTNVAVAYIDGNWTFLKSGGWDGSYLSSATLFDLYDLTGQFSFAQNSGNNSAVAAGTSVQFISNQQGQGLFGGSGVDIGFDDASMVSGNLLAGIVTDNSVIACIPDDITQAATIQQINTAAGQFSFAQNAGNNSVVGAGTSVNFISNVCSTCGFGGFPN